MSEELKPCPFCGGEAEMRPWKYNGHDRYDFFCGHCGCSFIAGTCETEEEAIARWNTRANEPLDCVECYECQNGAPMVPYQTCTMEKKKTGYFTDLVCSRCGLTSFYSYAEPGEHGMFLGAPSPNFCPMCGAKVMER